MNPDAKTPAASEQQRWIDRIHEASQALADKPPAQSAPKPKRGSHKAAGKKPAA